MQLLYIKSERSKLLKSTSVNHLACSSSYKWLPWIIFSIAPPAVRIQGVAPARLKILDPKFPLRVSKAELANGRRSRGVNLWRCSRIYRRRLKSDYLLERELVLLSHVPTLPDVALSNRLNSSAVFLLAAYQHSSADDQLVLARILNESTMITELVKILSSMWKGGQWQLYLYDEGPSVVKRCIWLVNSWVRQICFPSWSATFWSTFNKSFM